MALSSPDHNRTDVTFSYLFLDLTAMSTQRANLRIAVIGGGASGLSAAYLASKQHANTVTIYESNSILGGHANTVDVLGKCVDTGFLVYNENTYTNLCGLFEEIQVCESLS
jgi:predicted NAD/FAD-binding protein